MSTCINNLVSFGVLALSCLFAYTALWAPLDLMPGDRAFLVGWALAIPSVGALALYFLNQEAR